MSKQEHKTYSSEFKEYVAKMVVLDGHNMREISEKLSVPYGTLKRWVQTLKKQQLAAKKEGQLQLLTATEYKELYEKERQERLDIEEENEILKKAMHIFTQERK
ncbi:transposase [Oceanobacillus sp. CAU 1775]